MPYESSCTRSSAYDLSDYDEWSGRCWLTSDRALTNLVLSGTNRCCGPGDSYFLKSLGRANGFPALPPDGFICCIFRLTLLHVFYSWRSRTRDGVLLFPFFCSSPLNHRLVLIALLYRRPHSSNGVLVSRFQQVGTKKSGLYRIL